MAGHVLAPGYTSVQYWNEDRSDILDVRRDASRATTALPGDIPKVELDRLLKLGAVVEAGSADAVSPDVDPNEPAGNASRDAWASYADTLGLVVEPSAGRDEIKQLVSESRSK